MNFEPSLPIESTMGFASRIQRGWPWIEFRHVRWQVISHIRNHRVTATDVAH